MKKFTPALNGIFQVLKSEMSLKIHFVVAIITIVFSIFFKISLLEWCFVAMAIGSVIAAEIFNTAIEWLCDHIEPDQHKGIGLIKDASAGAVLILTIAAIVVGLIIFFPKIIALCIIC